MSSNDTRIIYFTLTLTGLVDTPETRIHIIERHSLVVMSERYFLFVSISLQHYITKCH